jgi:NADPH:quinone reductase-like Zn-dependent oxidoreductase
MPFMPGADVAGDVAGVVAGDVAGVVEAVGPDVTRFGVGVTRST